MTDQVSGELPYQAILTAIVQRFMRLVGAAVALNVARRVPLLRVDDEGNVLDYDRADPLNSITVLTESYAAKFGEAGVTLSRQAAQSVTRDTGKMLWPQSNWPLDDKAVAMDLLLVDDHELFRQGLHSLLTSQPDMRVVGQAGSAREAIALAHELKPSIVIMDISLPDGSGLEATRAILADQPGVKVIFLTIHDDDERLFAAIRAGAMGYMYKNARANDLLTQVRAVAQGEAGLSPTIARRILGEFSRTAAPSLVEVSAPTPTDLTPREIEIVQELARGASNREIAQRFFISEYTVKNHVRNVLAKLRLRSRREIASYARDHGITPASPSLKP